MTQPCNGPSLFSRSMSRTSADQARPQCLALRARRPGGRADRCRPIFRRGARGPAERALDRLHHRLGPRQPHPAGRRGRPGRRRTSRRPHRFPHRDRKTAAASCSFTFWCGTIRFSMPTSASCFRPQSLRWGTPRQIRFCLDDDLPFGASQHQKIVVVDDAVAFSGGLDLTTRRWDTREHRLDDPRRVDLAGVPYAPFHDVQAMVDGKAAAALAELARVRWARGACERAPPVRPTGDPWPHSVTPDLTDIDVGIARTSPRSTTRARSARSKPCSSTWSIAPSAASISRTSTSPRNASPSTLRADGERPELEAVLVTPKHAHSWLEEQTMQAGLGRFMQVFADRGVSERVALSLSGGRGQRTQHRHHGPFQGDDRRRSCCCGSARPI